MSKPIGIGNCPIREFTADGVNVGRCWYWLGETGHICPRHGNVEQAVEYYKVTGKLVDEPHDPFKPHIEEAKHYRV